MAVLGLTTHMSTLNMFKLVRQIIFFQVGLGLKDLNDQFAETGTNIKEKKMEILGENKLSGRVAAILAAVCLVLSANVVWAEQTAVELGTVVVTAPKQETLAKDTPGSISVVDAQIIDEQNIRTTEEMTRLVPNLFLKQRRPAMPLSVGASPPLIPLCTRPWDFTLMMWPIH